MNPFTPRQVHGTASVPFLSLGSYTQTWFFLFKVGVQSFLPSRPGLFRFLHVCLLFCCAVSGGKDPGVYQSRRAPGSPALRRALPQDVRCKRPGVVRSVVSRCVAFPQRQDAAEDSHLGLRPVGPAGRDRPAGACTESNFFLAKSLFRTVCNRKSRREAREVMTFSFDRPCCLN